MLKWLTITLVVIVVFATLLLGLGYLLKEHETATTLLKQELDQQRAQVQAKEKRKQARFKSTIPPSLSYASSSFQSPLVKALASNKQQVLLENLTCASTKQCVLIDIQFENFSCVFAINTIGASLLTKVADDLSSVGKCPDYPQNSQLSCELNICTYQ
jgi:hypothetical protein